jgi:hypothetical protein
LTPSADGRRRKRRRLRRGVPSAGVLAAAVVAVVLGTQTQSSPIVAVPVAQAATVATQAPTTAPAQPTTTPAIAATVGTMPTGQPMPPGFVGVSMEYKAVHAYTGRDPLAVNPVLVQLLKGLAPGQSPVLRIGGDSTDWTWWPVRGMVRPTGVSYNLNNGWIRTTRALAQAAGAKLILGVNLATARPALAATEARALLQGIGARYISALEIGNEPDLFGVFAWYRDRLGHVVFSRSHRYGIKNFIGDYTRWRAALPSVPLVGPSFAELSWMNSIDQFIKAEPQVKTITLHRYPLHGSTTNPSDPTYPSIPNLLSDAASSGLAQQVAPYVGDAHSRGLKFRLDEMNSVSNAGRFGVSDTFASALWVLDTLFNLASVGVDGVNIHTLPGAGYELFSFTHTASGWSAFVHPEYYGMYLFAQAFPPGAHLVPVTVPPGSVKMWATVAPDGHTRVVLINKDPTTPVDVTLALPSSTAPATLEQLTAPSLDATSGATLGGQSFGTATTTGVLAGTPATTAVTPVQGGYTVSLPAGSAALLTP